jgi:hypothetical protein
MLYLDPVRVARAGARGGTAFRFLTRTRATFQFRSWFDDISEGLELDTGRIKPLITGNPCNPRLYFPAFPV